MRQRGREVRWWLLAGLGGLFFFLWGGPPPGTYATHEVDHRFTVYGTVRDGTTFPGVLLAEKEVVIRMQGGEQAIQRAFTDAQGRYSMLLHVHNADWGKTLTVQCDGVEKRLTLEFNPQDTDTERRTRIDFVLFPR